MLGRHSAPQGSSYIARKCGSVSAQSELPHPSLVRSPLALHCSDVPSTCSPSPSMASDPLSCRASLLPSPTSSVSCAAAALCRRSTLVPVVPCLRPPSLPAPPCPAPLVSCCRASPLLSVCLLSSHFRLLPPSPHCDAPYTHPLSQPIAPSPSCYCTYCHAVHVYASLCPQRPTSFARLPLTHPFLRLSQGLSSMLPPTFSSCSTPLSTGWGPAPGAAPGHWRVHASPSLPSDGTAPCPAGERSTLFLHL